MMKHLETTYKIKLLIGGLLTVSDRWSMITTAGSMVTGRKACAGAEAENSY